jgi:hypothetical protein
MGLHQAEKLHNKAISSVEIGEKIFASSLSHKTGLLSKMYKECIQFNSRKSSIMIKNGKET